VTLSLIFVSTSDVVAHLVLEGSDSHVVKSVVHKMFFAVPVVVTVLGVTRNDEQSVRFVLEPKTWDSVFVVTAVRSGRDVKDGRVARDFFSGDDREAKLPVVGSLN